MVSECRRNLTPTLIFLAGVSALMALPPIAQSQDPVVPVSMERNHHVRFDNGKVRIYEVQLPKGKWTGFHEHTADNFYVYINATSQAFEYADGRHGTRDVKAGEVGFASTAKGPYTHRVAAEGDVPFHVVDLEILNNAKLGADSATAKRPESSFKVVMENSRGRAYDIVLKAGESTGPFTRPANTGIFAVSGGRVSETAEGKAPRLWDSEPGDFHWSDLSETLTITNSSASNVEFVEIEIF
jgi:hypothetical protein